MSSLSWLLIFMSFALLWGARRLYRHEVDDRYLPRLEAPSAPPASRPHGTRAARTAAPAVPAAPRAPAVIEWTPSPRAPTTPDAQRARLRDRYIAARFPGVLRGAEDLLAIEYVIKVARHYFEEGRLDDAAELFALAIEQSPHERALRLAQLEITFLARDTATFVRLARALRSAMPDLEEWDQVARLGRALAPLEPMFATAGDAGAYLHYGPWPDMPNWIQASWDLTSEVLAADFHRAIAACDAAAQEKRP